MEWGGGVAALRFSTSERGNWSANFRLPDGIGLHDNGWNGTFTLNGNILTITGSGEQNNSIGIHVSTSGRQLSMSDIVPVT
jgi:hypothetical protein